MMAGTAAGREGETASGMKLTETLAAATGVGLAGGLVAAGEAGGWDALALGGVLGISAMAAVLTVLLSARLSRHVAADEPGPSANPKPQLASEATP